MTKSEYEQLAAAAAAGDQEEETPEKRENREWRKKMGEEQGPPPPLPTKRDRSSSSASSDSEETVDKSKGKLDAHQWPTPRHLPVRRKVAAASFMNRFFDDKRSHIDHHHHLWLDDVDMGHYATVLGTFYRPDRLTSKQRKLADGFARSNRARARKTKNKLDENAKTSSPSSPPSPPSSPVRFHPYLTKRWRNMGLME